jgi:hypothetical protein
MAVGRTEVLKHQLPAARAELTATFESGRVQHHDPGRSAKPLGLAVAGFGPATGVLKKAENSIGRAGSPQATRRGEF